MTSDPSFLRSQKPAAISRRRAFRRHFTVLLIGFTMGVLLGDAIGRRTTRLQYEAQLEAAEQQVDVLQQRVDAILSALKEHHR